MTGQENKELPPCKPHIYEDGEHYAVFHGPRYWRFEAWKDFLQTLMPEGTEIDWHSYAGRAAFLAIGDVEEAHRITMENINWFEQSFKETPKDPLGCEGDLMGDLYIPYGVRKEGLDD